MPSRKITPSTVLNPAEDIAGSPTPHHEDSSPPLTKREAAKARHVSLKTAAAMLNRDRNTVMKWLDQGCPFVERGDKERGISWILDLADVVKWLEERAAKNVADRMGGIEGQITEDEAKRRIAVAKMITEETEAAEAVKMVARVHEMLAIIKKDYAELRSRLMGVPDALAAKVDAKMRDRVRKASEDLIRNALASLSADKGTGSQG